MYLSVPSVSGADATWYGSLRGGIHFTDDETKFYDGASRWGIKGKSEVSEGLTAVYNFEHKISTTDASQPGGRLANVGLSGGFGTLTLGQFWSASYNHAGVIRDFPFWHTSPDTSLRVGNALSYSLSTDVISFQIDAIMDGKVDTGSAIDQMEFGMTLGLGDVGKVALGYTTVEEVAVERTFAAIPATYETIHERESDDPIDVSEITVRVAKNNEYLTDGQINTNGQLQILRNKGTYKLGECNSDTTADDACVDAIAYETREIELNSSTGGGVEETRVLVLYYAPSNVRVKTEAVEEMTKSEVIRPETKKGHISAEFALGAVTTALGYSQLEVEGISGKENTTFIGVHGGIGDTGLNWGAYSRNIENADGSEKDSWTIGLSKSLGGGASTYIEHHNNDVDGSTTSVALRIDF